MNDSQALQIVSEAWRRVHGREPTANELVITTAIAALESAYGRAPGQHAEHAARGLYNWGNIEVRRSGPDCPQRPGETWVPGVDAGQSVCFRVWHTDVDAAAGFIHILTKTRWPTIAAMATGSPEAVARSMKVAPAYYSGSESGYAEGLRALSVRIRHSLAGGRGFDATIPVLLLAALAWWLLRRST